MDEFEGLYVAMGEQGWSVDEVDAMEVWQVARFLGVKGEPVIRGYRGPLIKPSEREGQVVEGDGSPPDFSYRHGLDPLADDSWGMTPEEIGLIDT